MKILTPGEALDGLRGRIRREWKTAFLSCVLMGLLIHMPILLSDIPNHDGLDSMYFDQNMITSGRWFLMIACGFSSFYTLPWVIGLLGLFFLGCGAAALCELLEVRKSWAVVLCSGLLVSFPALASTFAYVFTLDGYMLAILLAVLAVLLTKKYRRGYLPGAVCLAFSMGIYQAYLSFAMILSIFAIVQLFFRSQEENPGGGGAAKSLAGTSKTAQKHPEPCGAEGVPEHPGPRGAEDVQKRPGPCGAGTTQRGMMAGFRGALHYLYMGALGAALYYLILQVLLRVQGKELAGYQGIDGMLSGAPGGGGILSAVVGMYRDFAAFTLKGNILFQNAFSLGAWCLLLSAAAAAAVFALRNRKSWKNPALLVIIVVAALALPLAANVILLISPSVTYHLLMRYQWVLYAIGAVALVSGSSASGDGGRAGEDGESAGTRETRKAGESAGARETRKAGESAGARETGKAGDGAGAKAYLEWAGCLGAAVLVFCYAVTDNIAYSNLQKKYEKTYAYCVRLLDRIEQTDGYYPGVPVAMIGVVGDVQFPSTDLTLPVTSNMIGMSGDNLLYRGDNYEAFIRHYLGATLNILPAEAMEEMYYSEEYQAMDSFPGADSIRMIDGIMYIKTENKAEIPREGSVEGTVK